MSARMPLTSFTLSWSGKEEAIRSASAPFAGALLPAGTVGTEATGNLIIEGDNLDVLKALQPALAGQVKLIYIDPPYNTGHAFIYADNFRDHARWLSMIYPRLLLARELLRSDGLICISIDDHEVAHLRLVMDELFGEENFVAQFVWQSKKGGGGDVANVVTDHEYVLAYARNLDAGGAVSKQLIEAEPLDQVDEQGPYRKGRELNKWGSASRREDRPTMYFAIPGPDGEDVYPIRNDGSEGRWRHGREAMLALVRRGDVLFERRADGTSIVYEKIRRRQPRLKSFRSWLGGVGAGAEGTEAVKALFDGQSPFDFPKPLSLLQHLLQVGTRPAAGDIVLDFFAGSGTTGHAVLAQNRQDGGNRRFILVQAPEPTGHGAFPTIAHITRERVRRAIEQIDPQQGFRLLRVTSAPFPPCVNREPR